MRCCGGVDELNIFPFLGEFSSAEVISIDRDELRLDLRERPTAGGKWSRAEKRVGSSIFFFMVGQIISCVWWVKSCFQYSGYKYNWSNQIFFKVKKNVFLS